MTLAGGRPSDLTLSDFLDAGYALLVEAFSSVPGGHLMDALSKTDASFGVERPPEEEQAVSAAQNEQAMEMLQSRMQGVQGAPKPRRAR